MNAGTPLLLTSYDGSGQNVHPDVARIPGGFGGFEYWMACTPYPFACDRFENPVLKVSHDGLHWEPAPGVPDPLVPMPVDPEVHHADPDLVWAHGRLHLFYMTTNEGAPWTTFQVMDSADGRTWTEPVEILRGAHVVSPAVVQDEDGWHLWYVRASAGDRYRDAKVLRRSGRSAKEWEGEAACHVGLPGYTVWHLDVIRTEDGFEALVAAFPDGTTPARCKLFHMVSRDGWAFHAPADRPLLEPSWFGWDNRMIYRSTMVKRGGAYQIWYSAMSWGKRSAIGYLSGSLPELRPCPDLNPGFPLPPPSRVLQDAYGWVRYRVGRVLSATGLRG